MSSRVIPKLTVYGQTFPESFQGELVGGRKFAVENRISGVYETLKMTYKEGSVIYTL